MNESNEKKDGCINYLKFAFKNLNRHKFKSFVTISGIAFSILIYIWLDAWILGQNVDTIRNLLNYESGSAKIYSKAYFEKKEEQPLYESFNNYGPIVNMLDENGYYSAPHVIFTGMLKNNQEELPFKFIGIDPKKEKQVFRYHQYLEEGSEFITNGAFNINIGIRGAKNLGVTIGDKVKLYIVFDKYNEFGVITHIHQVINFKISGIINSPNPQTNGNIAYVPLDILQDEQGLLLDGHVTEICIRSKDRKDHELAHKSERINVIRDKISNILPENLLITSWKEDAKDFLATSKQDKIQTYLFICILFTLAVFGIVNVILIAIYERKKEIGILKSLGMNDFEIITLFLTEAGLIGFIASIIGISFGILINMYMVNVGVDFSEMIEKTDMDTIGYRIVSIYRSAWNWGSIVFAGFFAIFVAVVSSYFPVKKSIKMNLTDILRS